MDTQALTSAIRAIDAAASALGGLVDIGQLDPDQIRLLLESVQRCAAEGLEALDRQSPTDLHLMAALAKVEGGKSGGPR
ncbi:MAG: hypothetical protein WCY08_05975 [Rhodocyclaceae bacterium]